MHSPTVNNLQIEVATTNGDYSVSTNDTLANGLFKMGLDVTTRRIFPSNIKGAPSRYIIRLSDCSLMAPNNRTDIAVLLIEELAGEVLDRTVSGGVIVYDSTSSLGEKLTAATDGRTGSEEFYREDCVYYPVPLSQLAATNFSDSRLKRIMRNVIYVGVLSQLLGIKPAAIREVFKENFSDKGKKVINSNFTALKIGRNYARQQFAPPANYQLKEITHKTPRYFMRGNDATALGTVMGGCTYASWYPITPATLHGENLERYAPRYPLIVEQGENEDSCLGRALGAAWAGARASVSTSGPGLSNMAEFLGFSSFAEIPVVIFNIQRMGPATGLPTHTKQGDLLASLYLSHDESPRIILTPSTVEQLYDYSWKAFNIAARSQMPVVILSDMELGLSFYTIAELNYPEQPIDPGKILSEEELGKISDFERYRDLDGDGICYRSLPGKGPTYVTRGAYHDREANLSEKPADCSQKIERLFKKVQTAADSGQLPSPVLEEPDGAEVGIIGFGSSIYAIQEAVGLLREQDIQVALFDLPAISPLPTAELQEFIDRYKTIFVVEQNYTGQLQKIIQTEFAVENKLQGIRRYDGDYLTAQYISRYCRECLEQ